MKKFLVGLLIGAFALAGCVSMQMQKGANLKAEYYRTVRWGEPQSCMVGDTNYTGSLSKTFREYPEQDLKWVDEETKNGDRIEVTLVWDEEGPVLGLCFDDLDVDGETNKDYCGILWFYSETDKFIFMN